jgi:hypothetical protein
MARVQAGPSTFDTTLTDASKTSYMNVGKWDDNGSPPVSSALPSSKDVTPILTSYLRIGKWTGIGIVRISRSGKFSYVFQLHLIKRPPREKTSLILRVRKDLGGSAFISAHIEWISARIERVFLTPFFSRLICIPSFC